MPETILHPAIRARRSADRYLALGPGDELRAAHFREVVKWLTASYRLDGYTRRQLENMDLESAADDFIRRRDRG
jgi:hypothetical protein